MVDVCRSVHLSVVSCVSPAKTSEPIEMLIWVDPRNHVLDGVHISIGSGFFEGEGVKWRPIVRYKATLPWAVQNDRTLTITWYISGTLLASAIYRYSSLRDRLWHLGEISDLPQCFFRRMQESLPQCCKWLSTGFGRPGLMLQPMRAHPEKLHVHAVVHSSDVRLFKRCKRLVSKQLWASSRVSLIDWTKLGYGTR